MDANLRLGTYSNKYGNYVFGLSLYVYLVAFTCAFFFFFSLPVGTKQLSSLSTTPAILRKQDQIRDCPQCKPREGDVRSYVNLNFVS